VGVIENRITSIKEQIDGKATPPIEKSQPWQTTSQRESTSYETVEGSNLEPGACPVLGSVVGLDEIEIVFAAWRIPTNNK
jgi:hypothetical protein